MPRTSRASKGGYCYHVLNRGNGRADVFHSEEDYRSFLRAVGQACDRVPMRVVAYCLMPNHFHLVLWPRADGDLSRWMQWLLTTHVRRYRKHHGGSGHVWQGRFKAFPIQQDEHLLTVIRYVERNALRANFVKRAEAWAWCSLAPHREAFLHGGPCPRGEDWPAHVNRPQSDAELKALRNSGSRGTPFGGSRWQKLTANRLGLESTVRPRGRPRKAEKK